MAVTVAISAVASADAAPDDGAADDAADNETAVVVTGIGTTPEGARREALRQAVFQVVGGLVDAETLVRNDEVVRDQVLTATDGSVAHSEVVGTSRRRDDGLIEVTVKAVVKKAVVARQLIEAKVIPVDATDIPREIEGGHNREEAAKMLEQHLPRMRKQMLSAQVVDDRGQAAGKPAASHDARDGTVELAWNVAVTYDAKAYRAAAGNLVTLLNAITDEGQRGFSALHTPTANRNGGTLSLYALKKPIRWLGHGHGITEWPDEIPRGKFLLLVDPGIGRDKQNRTLNWYLLDEDPYYPMFQALQRPAALQVSVMGRNGDELARGRLPLDRTLLNPEKTQRAKPHPQHRVIVQEERVDASFLGTRSGSSRRLRLNALTGEQDAIALLPDWVATGEVVVAHVGMKGFMTDTLALRYAARVDEADAASVKELKLSFTDGPSD